MKVAIKNLTDLTLEFLDENGIFIDSKVDFSEPEAPIVRLAETLLPDTARSVILDAEVSEIDESEEFEADPEWTAPGRGTVPLPPDFLRLVSFRMSDWRRAVFAPIAPDGEEYSLHCVSGLFGRGRRRGPAVALRHAEGCLEFFGSSDPGAYVETARYIPDPVDSDDVENLRVPKSLVMRVAEATADRMRKIRS